MGAISFGGDFVTFSNNEVQFGASMTTLNLAITATADDGSDNGTAINDAGNPIFTSANTPDDLYLRFQNVNCPQGAVITSATLEFYVVQYWDAGYYDFTGIDEDNVAQITNSNLASTKDKTTATVRWNNPGDNPSGGWTALNTRYSVDVTAIVQEIVDRGGWAANNAICFFGDAGPPASGGRYVHVASYENAERATLDIVIDDSPSISAVNAGNPIVNGDTNIAIAGTNLNAEAADDIVIKQSGNTVSQANWNIASATAGDFDFVRGALVNGAATLHIEYPTAADATFAINISSPFPYITEVNSGSGIQDGDTNIAITGELLNLETPDAFVIKQGQNTVAQTNGAVADANNADFDFVRGTLLDGAATLHIEYPTQPDATWPITLIGATTTINLVITDTLDDGTQTGSTVNAASNPIGMTANDPTQGFFRFQSFNAVKNAVITQATLRLYGVQYWDAGEIVVSGIDEDNVAQLNNSNLPASKTLTTASTTFQTPGDDPSGGWTSLAQWLDVDVTAQVQEIVNRGGWASGNSIAMFVAPGPDDGRGHYLQVSGYESTSQRAQLNVSVSNSPSINGVDTDDVFTYDQTDVAASLINGANLTGTLSATLTYGNASDTQADIQDNTTNFTFDPVIANVPLGIPVLLNLTDDNGTYSRPVTVQPPAANEIVTMVLPVVSDATIFKGATHTPQPGDIVEYTEGADVTVFDDGSFQIAQGSLIESFQARTWMNETETWSAWVTVTTPLGFALLKKIVNVRPKAFTNSYTSVSPVLLNPIPDVSGVEGVVGSIDLNSYFQGATSFQVSGIPANSGVVFDGNSTINYTLNATDSANSPYNVTVSASNDNPTPTTDIFEVATDTPVTFSGTIPTQNLTEGQAFNVDLSGYFAAETSFVLEFQDPGDSSWGTAYYASGISINATTGELFGTPNAADASNDPQLRVVASNSVPSSATSNTFQAVVTDSVNPPVIGAIPNLAASQNVAFSYDLSQHVTNPGGGSVVYGITGLPQGSGLSINPNTGVLSGTANATDAAGSPMALVLQAQSTGGSDTQGFTLSISQSVVPVSSGTVITPASRTVVVQDDRSITDKVWPPIDLVDLLDYAWDLTEWLDGDTISTISISGEGSTIVSSGVFETAKFMIWIDPDIPSSTSKYGDAIRVTTHVVTASGREADFSSWFTFINK